MLATINHSVGDKADWFSEAEVKALFNKLSLSSRELYFADKMFNETAIHEFYSFTKKEGIEYSKARDLFKTFLQSGYSKPHSKYEWFFSQ